MFRKSFLIVAMFAIVSLSVLVFSGCGGDGDLPLKPGGGGLPQPYDPGSGQYR